MKSSTPFSIDNFMDKKTMQLWVEYVSDTQEKNSKKLTDFNESKSRELEDFVNGHKEVYERKNRVNAERYERALCEWSSKGFFFKLFHSMPEPPRIESHEDHFIVMPLRYAHGMPLLEAPSWEGFISWCASRYKITPRKK